MRRGQSGFTVVETLLLLILLAILGFTGYYVWHSQKQADKTLNAASSEKILAPTTKSPKKTPAPAISAADASKLVTDFYNQIYQAMGGSSTNPPDRAQEKALIQQYGTANLVSSYNNTQNTKDYDLIVCGQNSAPFSVTGSSVNGSKVIVKVHEAFSQTPIDFSVDVVNSSGLKIDAINCPQG